MHQTFDLVAINQIYIGAQSLSFDQLALHAKLLKSINDLGFTEPSDIQTQAIPHILEGKDVMASAPTGTGKTAAFVLPTLHLLAQNEAPEGHGPRVLVLTPTRELAKQVSDNIYQLTKYLRMRSTTIVGGVPYPPQIKMLRQSLDFLVATPGRLIDHMNSGRVDFSRVQMLILDEADRMLDMGFVDEVSRIAKQTPVTRQTLLFSATLEGQVEKVARDLLNKPVSIQIAGVKIKHDAITQHMIQADDFRHKRKLLGHILSDDSVEQAIVFTSTKKGADKLAEMLKDDGYACAALHGDMRQNIRRRVIEQMQRRRLKVLVATDVAARGLDIRTLSHVVNFDMPMQAEDYVHRIGRTGRGGSTGSAYSLIGPQDWQLFYRVQKLLSVRYELLQIAGLEPLQAKPKFNASSSKNKRRNPSVRYKKRGKSLSVNNELGKGRGEAA
ncbi:ATP-dependent RNA helicase SrmB [hydrothermal vent metagenome]|uniref:ATP-dependent RNA helicase SrmB n=1 Tax=hydrothermal vent metagenome TaxID=652676 RepID=A0A3B0WNX8_9ZZZZ